jgi:membrane-associated protein
MPNVSISEPGSIREVVRMHALGPSFLDPHWLISTFGLVGILVLVFAESGLLIGFFLPGDSLLFTAGLLVSGGALLHVPLWLLCLLVSVAAVAGDQFGYAFGRRFGPALFRRPDSRVFKQQNLIRAQAFFGRYGARSIVLARFVPIVRTFTPIVAGASGMRYRVFALYNILGGTLWGCGVTILGYFLADTFPPAARPTATTVWLVAAAALGVAVAATLAPALRAARTSTLRALNDPARPPRRRARTVAVSARLPVPMLLGLRLIARRQSRAILYTLSTMVFGLSAAQLAPAGLGALAGLPTGLAVYHAATQDNFTAPPLWHLLAVLLGTITAVVAVTAVPARLGAHRPIAGILGAETT